MSAVKPGDRVVLFPLEKVLSTDHNKNIALLYQTLEEQADKYFTARSSTVTSDAYAMPSTAFFGDSYKIRAQNPAAMAVDVTKGMGFFLDTSNQTADVGGVSGLNDLARYKLINLNAAVSFTVPNNASGSTRIDIIELKLPRLLTDSESRDTLDEVTETINSTAESKTLTFSHDSQTGQVTSPTSSSAALSYKTGVAGAGVPSTTAGYVRIGLVVVASGATSIAQSSIIDTRSMLGVHGVKNIYVNASITTGTGAVTVNRLEGPPGVAVSVSASAVSSGVLAVDVTVTPGAMPALNQIWAEAQLTDLSAAPNAQPITAISGISSSAPLSTGVLENFIVSFYSRVLSYSGTTLSTTAGAFSAVDTFVCHISYVQ